MSIFLILFIMILFYLFLILLGILFHSLGYVIRILFINCVDFENGIL